MTRSAGRRHRPLVVGVRAVGTLASVAIVVGLSGCASSSSPAPTASTGAGTCPVQPINVVATTNVWGNIVNQLAGPCASVTTVITSPNSDPHEFQPDSATSASYAEAKLVVENGLGYDAWSDKIVASLGSDAPAVLDLGQRIGLKVGDNPHIWYSPEFVQRSADAITESLKQQLPQGANEFTAAASAFTAALAPYLSEVEAIKNKYANSEIGATESVFSYMAQATSLNLTTPPGFMSAIANGSEPSSQDVATFTTQLTNGTDKVLVYNSQTEGGLPTQLRATAQGAGVPVVTITETLAPAGATFQSWQTAQLQELDAALAKSRRSTPTP